MEIWGTLIMEEKMSLRTIGVNLVQLLWVDFYVKIVLTTHARVHDITFYFRGR